MIGRRRGPGLVGMMARTAVVAGTATAVSGSVSRHQQKKVQQEEAGQQPPTTAPVPMSTADQITQLQDLAKLKDSGILTQAEFDAKKQQILGL